MNTTRILTWEQWTPEEILIELTISDLSIDVFDRVCKLMSSLDLEAIKHSYLIFAGQKAGIRHYTFDALRFVDAVRHSEMDFFLRPGAHRVTAIFR